MGATDGGGWIAVYCWCNATLLHHAPLVTGGHGLFMAGKLDGFCVRQLAFNNFSTLHLVVHPVRVFVYASL